MQTKSIWGLGDSSKNPTIVGLTVLHFFTCLAFSLQGAGTQNEFVIRNSRMFDGTRVIPKGDVWVQNGVIKDISAHLRTPAGAVASSRMNGVETTATNGLNR